MTVLIYPGDHLEELKTMMGNITLKASVDQQNNLHVLIGYAKPYAFL